jgi:hypothetical protein
VLQVSYRCVAMEQLPFMYGLAGFWLIRRAEGKGVKAQLAPVYCKYNGFTDLPAFKRTKNGIS